MPGQWFGAAASAFPSTIVDAEAEAALGALRRRTVGGAITDGHVTLLEAGGRPFQQQLPLAHLRHG